MSVVLLTSACKTQEPLLLPPHSHSFEAVIQKRKSLDVWCLHLPDKQSESS